MLTISFGDHLQVTYKTLNKTHKNKEIKGINMKYLLIKDDVKHVKA